MKVSSQSDTDVTVVSPPYALKALLPHADVASEYSSADPRAFLDNAPLAIHWVDAEGTIIWANRTELDMLGYDADDYIGHHVAEFHADSETVIDILSRLQNGETLRDYEARLCHKDGSIRVGAITSNVLWSDGKFVHTRCFTRDITEAKQFEQRAHAQFEELENLYRTAPIGLAMLDAQFRFLRVNERLAQINGISAERHIGRTVREVVPHLAQQAQTVYREMLQSRKPILNVEFAGATTAHPDTECFWNVSYHPVYGSDDAIVGTSVVIEEITERKRAEAALAESARITDALYQLTDHLHRAKSLDDVYGAALAAIIESLRCGRASILLYDESNVMRFVGWRGLSEGYRRAVEGHSPWSRDESNPKPICIDNVAVADLGADLKATVLGEGIHACAFIPLVAAGHLIGKFMTYFDAPHAFSAQELDLCMSIARQLAFGIEKKRAEEALRDRERHLREMIDALPAAIYTTDATGYVTHFNPAAVEFSGRTPEQIAAERWCVSWKLRNADGTPLAHSDCPMAIAINEGRPVRGVEAIAERPDGTQRWFAPYPTPLRDANNRVIGGINMLVDITERKETEQTLRKHAKQLALVTDTAPVFIAYCDLDSRFKFVNKPYADRLGLQPEDCVGRHIADVIGESAYESIRQYVDVVLSGQQVEFEASVPYASLGEHFMHCSYAPEFDAAGRVVGWVAAITDITERKRIEEALRASEEKLKETDRRKDEFLAMLAHELRNPLAPIANAVHLLRQERSGSDLLQQARAIIDRQTGRLARLVDDLLEVSRITTGRIQLHMERVAVSGIIERAVETVQPLIEQHRHTLNVALPPDALWVYGDSARLEQVIVNLLTNAAKYTDGGGHIALSVRAETNHVIVSVQDTGIGISPELLPRVFDLFTQSERSLDRSHGGLGIGLSLVQRLVTMHGGTVTAESVLGKGSEFSVRLPLAPPATHESYVSDTQATEGSGRPLRVLVVDDNVDAAQSLAMLLQISGHVVGMAHDGKAAIEVAADYRPHVVLLDIGLPKLDGYAVAEELRKNPALAGLVLVAVTGYGQANDRERARAAGFDRHLVKPVDFSSVEQILAEAAKKSAL